ncbi:potassium transporter [Halioglobus maricola]|uniref:Potassium transporter n=1 Tax=Halioglobus maricola TaxID=2601894 RepID=A0A5P9NM32_9GAMM|nr:monovalent cation:proton antiporter-2 (CPA2) family protein [Halioglobus maricola]QFU76923.1 potassium transporter [Halioglobus maricola]
MTAYFLQGFIYLIAAIIAVPLAKRLGLGSVLGYLIAGVIIGPVTGLVGQETVTIQHFAEFGVVMMLFLVGMELDPRSLWEMRNKLLGLGGLQLSLTVGAVTAICLLIGLDWSIALTIGLVLSLSSTAIVLQTFSEKGLTNTEGGRSAFSVLLFQDIAVIPMLAMLPLLAIPELVEIAAQHGGGEHHVELSLVAHMPPWAHALVVIASVVGLIVAGRVLSRPLFHYVASSGLPEIFTATALMLVVGIAALMSLVGLSPALGTFLAGVVLANSEFRHELESDIEPFKGLLLGLFFITVGAGINFAALQSNLLIVIAATLGLMAVKGLVLLIIAIIFKIRSSARWLLCLSLAQAGEFGFVLLSYTQQHAVLPAEIAQVLSLVVALSMFLTPALFIFFDRVITPRYKETEGEREPDKICEYGPVIIAGTGRFGQIVNRMLVANGIETVVLDHKASQIEEMRKINIKSYYGDATRTDLLHAAGIEKASLLVVAIDEPQRALELVEQVKKHHPHVKILARAYDRMQNFALRHNGADVVISETYHSALEMGEEALLALNYHPFRAQHLKYAFEETEDEISDDLYLSWRDEDEANTFSEHTRDLFLKLEDKIRHAMGQDRDGKHSRSERGWTPPPKNYLDTIQGDDNRDNKGENQD